MALEVFRLIGSVFVDTDSAEKSLQKTDKKASGLGTSLANGFKAAGQFAATVGKAALAVGGAVVTLTETTREYRTEQGKLEAAFKAAGFEGDEARKTYSTLNGVLGDSGQAVEAANHLALLCDSEEELAEMTNAMTGIYATFGDSLPLEGLAEAANETAKVGKVTGSFADALNWVSLGSEGWREALGGNKKALAAFSRESKAGANNEDAFTAALEACSNEQERQALITSTLNVAYGDAAEKYREVNGEVIAANTAQDNLTNTLANIGGLLEPIVTRGKEILTEVLERFAPTITDLAEVAIPFLLGAFETLVIWLETAVQWFKDAYTWITENETAVTLIAIAIGTLAAALTAYQIAQNAATIATTFATAATTAWGAAVAFLTSPITLIILAIGALIAIIYLLVTNWDTVKAAAGAAWEYIKNVWQVVSKWFDTNVVQPVKKGFDNGLKAVRETFSNAWTGIKNIWSAVSGFFSGIWTSIKNTFSNVTNWFRDKFSEAWTAVKNVFSTGGKIFEGMKEGISDVFKSVVNAIIRGINKVIAVPFGKINDMLSKIRNVSIMGLSPFSFISTFSVPKIPELEEGAVLERGQVGLLEGNGAEAVVPLHKNQAWIGAVARDMDAALGGTSGNQVLAVLLDILAAIEAFTGVSIRLDTGALVGALAKPMDRKLGQLQAARGRT